MTPARPQSLLRAIASSVGLLASVARGQPMTATIDVDLGQSGTPLSPMFSGLMTEEINHAFDGGLYAELIRNRTFQDDEKQPAHWSGVGGAKLTLDRSEPVNDANPICLRVEFAGDGTGGAANAGYWGIPVNAGTPYAVSFYARAGEGFIGPVTAAIVGDDGTEYARAATEALGPQWKKYTLTLTTAANVKATKSAKFVLSGTGGGTAFFNLVSLFPPTYRDTPGGLRPDLMRMMAALKPAFIRLPGGNYLEGSSFATRFEWKKQIGPVDQRPGHWGCWGYRSSDGMGLTQMLLWCRQLNAEPILGVFAGYTLNKEYVAAGPKLQPYVDEALEEIEYVIGGPETQWGKKRIEDGLTEPFKLEYVEVGNEDWFDASPSYDGRFTQFYDAIKAKYPHLKIIATAPVKSRKPDLYDDHFYQSPNAMVRDANHYDRPADPTAKADLKFEHGRFNGTFARGQVPDVLVGEWATQQGRPTPTLRAALADAVWLMGMERNADLIKLQCYAPLFANVNPGGWQWGTNLIGYDAMSAFGSPSYHAQVMFAQNRPDRILPVTVKAPARKAMNRRAPAGAVGLGSYRTDVEYKDFRVSSPDGEVSLEGAEASDVKKWQFGERSMVARDGTIKPSEPAETCWGVVGEPTWGDYTISVKARKNAGEEGFLVLWHAADLDTYQWWNIGGWGNTRTQFEVAQEGVRTAYGKPSDFRAETGRWYDLRFEVRGTTARGFIDGKMVSEATDPPPSEPAEPLHAGAGYIDGSKEVVIKVVNFGGEPIDATLNLHGAKSVNPAAKATVLRGEPRDVNSIEQPTKVVPREEPLEGASTQVRRTFPPNSFTLIRVGAPTE